MQGGIRRCPLVFLIPILLCLILLPYVVLKTFYYMMTMNAFSSNSFLSMLSSKMNYETIRLYFIFMVNSLLNLFMVNRMEILY